MTITLTKPKTQVVWRSTTSGAKATSIPGSVSGNKGFALDIKTTLGNGDTHTVTPASGTIGGQPTFTFTDTDCNLSLISDADNADWVIRCLCCLGAPVAPGPSLDQSFGGVWDNTSGGAGMQTYSNGDTVVNPNNTTGPFAYPASVWRSTTSHSTGRYWFEVHTDIGNTMQLIWQLIGLANDNFPHTSNSVQLGSSLDGVGLGSPFLGSAGVWIGGSRLVPWSTTFVGRQYTMVCVNLNIKRIWIETSLGVFNFSPTASPNTNVGGWDISSINSGPYRITMSQVVQRTVVYPPLTIVSLDNIGDAVGVPPSFYAPW